MYMALLIFLRLNESKILEVMGQKFSQLGYGNVHDTFYSILKKFLRVKGTMRPVSLVKLLTLPKTVKTKLNQAFCFKQL